MKHFSAMTCVQRYSNNPVLRSEQVPYPSSLVFNAGVVKFHGKYLMAFRNDYGCGQQEFAAGAQLQTNIGLAESDDGIHWTVRPKPLFSAANTRFNRAYDPRLSVIDGRCYMCYAMDGFPGVVGGIAVTDDFEKFDILYSSEPDNRNMVLFPEKINGNFIRLDRPMPVYGRGGAEEFDLWLSESPDCRYWGKHHLLLDAATLKDCNSKCGPGAPPIKTAAGWLTTFHGVWKCPTPELFSWEAGGWNKIYWAGLMLLDLDDPTKILGIAKQPLLAPCEPYELQGFRGSAIFPGGMILEDSGEVKIYYGSADTVECLATADVNDLIGECLK